jgi:hypothetical protein
MIGARCKIGSCAPSIPAPTCTITSPSDDATVTGTPITITGTSTDDISGPDIVEISTDGGATWAQAVGSESWSHQWWPPLSGDYELSCRATDLSENQGSASSAMTVHADLERTMNFDKATARVVETAGTYNVTVTLDAPRATEVNAELAVSGTATAGEDFDEPPQTVRFFPGQTTLVFPITITDDGLDEDPETLVLTLSNPNLPDVTFGSAKSLTVTILPIEIFDDGFEENDTSQWSSVVGAAE